MVKQTDRQTDSTNKVQWYKTWRISYLNYDKRISNSLLSSFDIFRLSLFALLCTFYCGCAESVFENESVKSRSSSRVSDVAHLIALKDPGGKVSVQELQFFLDDIYEGVAQAVRYAESSMHLTVVDTIVGDSLSGEQAFELLQNRHSALMATYTDLAKYRGLIYTKTKSDDQYSSNVLITDFYLAVGPVAISANPVIDCRGSIDEDECWYSGPFDNCDGVADGWQSGDCEGENLDQNAQTRVQRALNQEVPRHIPGNKYDAGKVIVYEDIECVTVFEDLETFGSDIALDWDCCLDFPFYESAESTLTGGQLNCYQSFIRDAIVNKIPEGFTLTSVNISCGALLSDGLPMIWNVDQYCFGRPVEVEIREEELPVSADLLIGG